LLVELDQELFVQNRQLPGQPLTRDVIF